MFNITLTTIFDIILRTTLIYLVILVGLRLAGKREIGQLTMFDLINGRFIQVRGWESVPAVPAKEPEKKKQKDKGQRLSGLRA